MLDNQPIKIGILEVSPQNKSILEFFFDGAGKALFKEVNQASASAFIIDFDFPGAKESWQEHFSQTNKPGIIMSIHEVDIPSAIWIAKPLTTKALIEAGKKVRAMIIDSEAYAQKNESTVLEESKESNSKATAVIHSPQEIELIEEKVSTVVEESVKQEKEVSVQFKEAVTADAGPASSFSEPDQTNNTAPVNEISNDHIAEVEELLQSLMAGTESSAKVEESSQPQTKEATFEESNLDLSAIELEPEEDIEQVIPEEETKIETKVESQLDSLDQNIQEFSLLKEATEEENTSESANQVLEIPEILEVKVPNASLDIESNKEKVSEEKIESLIDTDTVSNLIEREAIEPHITVVEKDKCSDIELLDLQQESTLDTDEYRIENEKTSVGLEEHRDTSIDDTMTEEERAEEAARVSAKSFAMLDSYSNQEAKVVIDKDAPLSAEEELQRLLDEIREEAENSKLIERDGGAPKGLSGSDNAGTEERWIFTCGKNPDIKSKKQLGKIAYNERNYISAILKHVLEKARASQNVMRMKLGKTIIVVDTENDSVYCNTPIMEDKYAEICLEAVDKNNIKIHNLDKSEIRMYLRKAETRPENSYSIESFVWTTSLLSSHGRLPKGTNLTQKVGLKYWPNLTRLESFPHVIQIAAVFKKHPGNLLDVAKWLEIPQSSVFAFYNGALALEILEFDQEKLNAANTNNGSSKNKKENRGFFSRLLKRITR